jgi:hypothetical protein
MKKRNLKTRASGSNPKPLLEIVTFILSEASAPGSNKLFNDSISSIFETPPRTKVMEASSTNPQRTAGFLIARFQFERHREMLS